MIGILGFGEIGTAVSRLYSLNELKINDPAKGFQDSLINVSVLNVCIPWNSNFIDIIVKILIDNRPNLCIIHSTVKPGTTQKIKELTNMPVIHSPVRGIHPNLYESLFLFTKYVGGETDSDVLIAKMHLEELGLTVYGLKPSRASEVLKILSTTQYGLQIAFAQEMKNMCRKYGVSYNAVVNHANMTYNEGYEKLGRPEYKRSILRPPDEYVNPGEKVTIGGHCVSENLEILLEDFPENDGLKFIKKYSKFTL